ncbi:MAG: hypothetical protein LBP59_01305 [Planctomycetaceae bacterium]|jgi:hypothetical protein|nr:hypothetical protein [Planctomycetaceae bacterium]
MRSNNDETNFRCYFYWHTFKLFALEFAFTAACLAIGRQAFTLFKLFALEFSFTFACLAFGRQAFTLLNH